VVFGAASRNPIGRGPVFADWAWMAYKMGLDQGLTAVPAANGTIRIRGRG